MEIAHIGIARAMFPDVHVFELHKFQLFENLPNIYTFPTRTPCLKHFPLKAFPEISHPVHWNPYFHTNIWMGACEYLLIEAPRSKNPWAFLIWESLRSPCIKLNISRKVSIWCKHRVLTFFVGCPRPPMYQIWEVSRPTVWGGGSPPVRKKFKLVHGGPRSAWLCYEALACTV